jgi:rod shape-determining protein MreC
MAAQRNAELKKELGRSHRRLIEARAIEQENRRLKRLLKLSEEVNDDVATARIVGSSFDSSRRLATLSAGSSAGIQIGQPVRAPEGLLGRILETGRFASRVLLITDGASSVPVQMIRNGTPALATGRGDGTIDLKTLEVGENPFRRGDVVVTSGVGGVFPPNAPVAIVIRADRETTVARPLADPSRVDFAIVQAIFQPAANQPLNPPPPPRQQAAK